MVADIESGERCYVAIPENLEDKKVLRNVFERFERLIYGQVILSLLDGDEDTFDSLFRCIQTLQRKCSYASNESDNLRFVNRCIGFVVVCKGSSSSAGESLVELSGATSHGKFYTSAELFRRE